MIIILALEILDGKKKETNKQKLVLLYISLFSSISSH